jgi:hypothetical protein
MEDGMRNRMVVGVLFSGLVVCACGGSGGSGDSVKAGPTAPTPSSPATPVSQNGCSATYTCPTTDANGGANPTTPTLDRLTVSNGTSTSCRADFYRNSPSPPINIEFTVRNAQRFNNWRTKQDSATPYVSTSPGAGLAETAGPYQAVATLGGPGLGQSSGETFSQNLVIELITAGPNSPPFNTIPAVAACGVTLYGYTTPGK